MDFQLTAAPSLGDGKSLDLTLHVSIWLATAGTSLMVTARLLVSFSNQGLSLMVRDW
jgi:hypothetical protein